MKINIAEKNKAAVIKALYDKAVDSSWSTKTRHNLALVFAARSKELTIEQANDILQKSAARDFFVDYCNSVCMKIDFSQDEIDVDAYCRDNEISQKEVESLIEAIPSEAAAAKAMSK